VSCECGPGAAGVNGGRLSCVSCLPGTFTPDVGAETCATCAAGSFVAGHGAVECGECDAGFYSTGGEFILFTYGQLVDDVMFCSQEPRLVLRVLSVSSSTRAGPACATRAPRGRIRPSRVPRDASSASPGPSRGSARRRVSRVPPGLSRVKPARRRVRCVSPFYFVWAIGMTTEAPLFVYLVTALCRGDVPRCRRAGRLRRVPAGQRERRGRIRDVCAVRPWDVRVGRRPHAVRVV